MEGGGAELSWSQFEHSNCLIIHPGFIFYSVTSYMQGYILMGSYPGMTPALIRVGLYKIMVAEVRLLAFRLKWGL